jgi:hypothetical protein
LLASRAVAALSAVAFFLDRLPFGAPWAPCGAAGVSRRWMAFQIRVTAVLRSVSFLIGFSSPNGGAPAKLFQTWTSSSLLRHWSSFSSSFSLAKLLMPSPAGTSSGAA